MLNILIYRDRIGYYSDWNGFNGFENILKGHSRILGNKNAPKGTRTPFDIQFDTANKGFVIRNELIDYKMITKIKKCIYDFRLSIEIRILLSAVWVGLLF